AFGRPRRIAAAKAAVPATAQLATVGVGAGGGAPVSEAGTPAAPSVPAPPARRAGPFKAIWAAGPWVRAAVALRALGALVMGAVGVALGLAEALINTPAGPLVPALQSYWLSIHVAAMTLATGIFFVAAVLGIMYLVAERYRKRVAAGKAQPGNGLIARIPSAAQLDKLTYRTVIFGFPVW